MTKPLELMSKQVFIALKYALKSSETRIYMHFKTKTNLLKICRLKKEKIMIHLRLKYWRIN